MYLLDTDTLIYSLKGRENVLKNISLYISEPKAMSVISFGELVYGAYKSQRVIDNLAKIHQLKEILPVLDITPAIMETFGNLKAELSKKGTTVDDFDLLIAATSITCSYTLVTNNTNHYENIPGVKVTNWNT